MIETIIVILLIMISVILMAKVPYISAAIIFISVAILVNRIK